MVFQESLNYLIKLMDFAEKGFPYLIPGYRDNKTEKIYPMVNKVSGKMVYIALDEKIITRIED